MNIKLVIVFWNGAELNYSENLGERENPIATSDNWIIRDTMHIYKELILKGNKTDFDEFKNKNQLYTSIGFGIPTQNIDFFLSIKIR